MSPLWILVVLLYPLAGVVAAMVPRTPALVVRFWMATLALPALAVSLALPDGASLEAAHLLLGSPLAWSDSARLFLLFTSILWSVAGLYSGFYTAPDPRFRGYAACFLASFAGNAGLFFSTDIPQFYTFFAVMTFSAYGLVVHTRTPDAVRAGQLYIGMAVLGEMMVLSGLIWLAHSGGSLLLSDAPAAVAASPHRTWIIALLLFGFGVKAGLLPVHVWLPLAHPVAPTPASAVLSGAMIKAGLFGWLVFLPGGVGAYPGWGSMLVGVGLLAALGAAFAGMTQTHPKVNLAYSSISQMGVLTMGLGMGLNDPGAWETVTGVLAFYALNHALAKGALFLAVGAAHAARREITRRWVLAGSLLAALVLVGGPWTGGSLSKAALKKVGSHAPEVWSGHVGWLLAVSAFATTLLLVRFLFLQWESMKHPAAHSSSRADRGVLWTWGGSVLICLGVPWLVALHGGIPIQFEAMGLGQILKAWPILLGAVAGYGWLRRPVIRFSIPAGDLGLWVLAGSSAVARWWVGSVAPRMESMDLYSDRAVEVLVPDERAAPTWLDGADRHLRGLGWAGSAILTLSFILWWSTGS